MIIRKLQVENLRNIERVDLRPHPVLNYVCGDNGAGKTSLFEAIAVLSRGRSFRTTQPGEMTGPCGSSFRVFAEIRDSAEKKHRLGLERSGSHWRGRIDGQDILRLSELSRFLPVVLMVPDSHMLVSGAPENRRKYLDWGLFHVERGFLSLWKRYSKALKQRNAALRNGQLDLLDSLDEGLSKSGTKLGEFRQKYTGELSARLESMLAQLKTRVKAVELNYREGWNGKSYLDALVSRRARDMERGVTSAGPHRADLELACQGSPARAVLSRGEQKAFAAAMLLTQAEMMQESGVRPVLLLDDLVSEFDQEHFKAVLEKSLETGSQIWVNGTVKPDLGHDHGMFHVEQGRFTELV